MITRNKRVRPKDVTVLQFSCLHAVTVLFLFLKLTDNFDPFNWWPVFTPSVVHLVIVAITYTPDLVRKLGRNTVVKCCGVRGCENAWECIVDVSIKGGNKKKKLHLCREHFSEFKEEYYRMS